MESAGDQLNQMEKELMSARGQYLVRKAKFDDLTEYHVIDSRTEQFSEAKQIVGCQMRNLSCREEAETRRQKIIKDYESISDLLNSLEVDAVHVSFERDLQMKLDNVFAKEQVK